MGGCLRKKFVPYKNALGQVWDWGTPPKSRVCIIGSGKACRTNTLCGPFWLTHTHATLGVCHIICATIYVNPNELITRRRSYWFLAASAAEAAAAGFMIFPAGYFIAIISPGTESTAQVGVSARKLNIQRKASRIMGMIQAGGPGERPNETGTRDRSHRAAAGFHTHGKRVATKRNFLRSFLELSGWVFHGATQNVTIRKKISIKSIHISRCYD